MDGRVAGAGFLLALAGLAPASCGRGSGPATRNSVQGEREGEDRSFYAGKPVTRPEELSGVWEAPDGAGGAVGLQLQLTTTVPADKVTLVGTTQFWEGLYAGFYRRSGPVLQIGEANYFSDSPRGGGVRLEEGRLLADVPEVNVKVDLRRGAGDVWVGRFRRGDFEQTVTLRRPDMAASRTADWYAGTWLQRDGTLQRCIHLGREPGGALTGWSDSLRELGSVRYRPKVKPQATARETYGELLKAQPLRNGGISVQLGAYRAACCQLSFTGSRAGEGRMSAEWAAGAGEPSSRSVWRRVPGDRCIVAAHGSDRRPRVRRVGSTPVRVAGRNAESLRE